MENKKIVNTIRILPWLIGLTSDLMFYIAINTLFLTIVKGFNASQISLFTSIPCLFYVMLQPLFLNVIKKVGNKISIIVGCIMLLVASIIITFFNSFETIMIGQIVYTLANIFLAMSSVMLKNNLIYIHKQDDYIKILNKGNVIYSIITTIIAGCSGYLFKINYYLPMYLCIVVCIINVLLSFILTEKIPKNYKNIDIQRPKVKFSKIILLIVISYGIFYSTIGRAQSNIKLIIQYCLNDKFNAGDTAIYFSYILLLSRLARVICSLLFNKIYQKTKDKIGYYIASVCCIALILVIVGYNLDIIQLKYIFMIMGFCMILGIRDIYGTFSKNLVLKNSNTNEQQTFISYLGLSRKIGETILSFGFSIVLLKFDIIFVIYILLFLGVLSIYSNYKIYRNIKMINNQ